ncbi:MAG: hydantoinase B/oxoprolinase family protein [Thaumarchaeota archaeon]|nr:hydantoinase B/oxoprolinase family protein [Nitrososphaerota archaeon]
MKPDAVDMRLISDSLLYASEEMGLALRNSAYSPNIKERMDHSAAVFDPDGRLLAQAEHIPVHLGSLPWGLRNLIEKCRAEGLELSEGTMAVSNNPYVTGTHLNDVTVVSPVYHKGELVGYVANKAHHSDVGGMVPGSISMESRTLQEEGFVLDLAPLTERGEFVKKTVDAFAAASRTPSERIGDLKAQKAANFTGIRRVLQTVSKHGAEAYRLAASASFRHSESLMRNRLSHLKQGSFNASEVLEGEEGKELKLRASVTISSKGVSIDYRGTDRQVDYPLNAIFGVTISGAYYVLRTLTGDDIPANHGAFSLVKVAAPVGCLLNPTFPRPVGGGNVETSQRNADLLFRALSKAAPDLVPSAAGGSMNNVMMGGFSRGRGWTFYETIGVGLGGSKRFDGVDGIQANMTNTMNTPIEEIERSFPLMITKYEFRAGSSGRGQRRGGAGLVRRFRAMNGKTTLTVLADRELHRPWGLNGGSPGVPTRAFIIRRGKRSRISCKSTRRLEKGDEFEMRTAGGGGYGPFGSRSKRDLRNDRQDGLVWA